MSHQIKTADDLCRINHRLFCDSGGIRTHDPQLRRLLLYPAELRNHVFQNAKVY